MSGIVGKNLGRGSGVVKATPVGADTVDSANIADDAIDSEHYADGSIDNAHIADDAIDSEHYADGSIDNAHIADDAIDSEHYADGSIDNAHIADDAIDSEHYATGSIDTAHIATNQIDETLMKDAFVGDFTDATVTASDYFLHGDATDSGNTKKDTVQGILDLTSGGYTEVGEEATTSGSTSTISGIPSSATRILVVTNDPSMNALAELRLTIGDSGGIETASYISTNGKIDNTACSADSATAHWIIADGGGAGDLFPGHAQVTKANSTDDTWIISSSMRQSAGATNLQNGSKTLSGTLTQLQLSTNQTFDAGSWNVFYQ